MRPRVLLEGPGAYWKGQGSIGRTNNNALALLMQTVSAVSRSRQRLLRPTADIVCYVPQQTISAVSDSSHCLPCPMADNVCCVEQQTTSAAPQQTFLAVGQNNA